MPRRKDPIKSKFRPDPDRRKDPIKSKFKPKPPLKPRPKLPGVLGPPRSPMPPRGPNIMLKRRKQLRG